MTEKKIFEFDKTKRNIIGLTPYGRRLTEITVPSKIDGVDVLSIGNCVFSECIVLETVTVSEGIKKIGNWAFSESKALKHVNLPEGLGTIAYCAFADCISLEELIIPNGTTEIGVNAFAGCKALETVTIPASMKYINEEAFLDCKRLHNIYYDGTKLNWTRINHRHNMRTLRVAIIHYAK